MKKIIFKDKYTLQSFILLIIATLQFGLVSTALAAETPKQIGQCLGFLGQLLKSEGSENFTQLNRNYIVKHKSALDIITKIGNEQRGCLRPGVDMEACLVGYNEYQKTLFYGYNSGRQGYMEVRVSDPSRKATWQMACASVN